MSRYLDVRCLDVRWLGGRWRCLVSGLVHGLFLVLLLGADVDERLPEPELDGMERAVQAQLRAVRDRALARLDDGADLPEVAEALGALGRLYQFYGLDSSAEAALQMAAARAPDVADWAYHLGVLYQRQRRLDEAATSFDHVLAMQPDDLPAALRRAEVARLAGDDALATRGFEAVLARDPDPAIGAAAHLGLGRLAVGTSVLAARQHFERAVALQPRATAVLHELGLAWRTLGDRDKARQLLQAARDGGNRPLAFPDPRLDALETLATGTAQHVLQANQALRAGDVDAAVDAFRRALDLDPLHLPARQGLAAALSRRGDLDAAEAEYRHVLAQVPDAAGVWYALGSILSEQEQLPEAIEALERALELLPEHRDAHFNLGLLQLRAGDAAGARSSFERAIELDPQDAEARRQLAAVLQQLDRSAEAAAELEWLVAADPGDAESREALAALYLTRGGELGRGGRFSASSAALARAVELQPTSIPAHFGRFTALLLAEDYGDALAAVEHSRAVLGQQGLETLPFDHGLARLLATCPDPAQRDGERALELAFAVFEAHPSTEHGETVAMALAELGRFDEAIGWQLRVLEQLERLGRGAQAGPAQQRLASYRAGQPVRAPWK